MASIPLDRIRILLLADHFYGATGGTEQHILFLLRCLPDSLFQTHFALLSNDEETRSVDFPVIPTMLSTRRCSGLLRGSVQRLHRLVRLIRSAKIDVIHTFNSTSEAYALLAVKLARRGAVLGARRNVGYWHTSASLWSARLRRVLGAKYVANCMAAKDFAITNEWISESRISVISNPVPRKRLEDAQRDATTTTSLGILPENRAVAMVATVRPIKDYETYLHAARLVLNQHPNTRFLSIGGQQPQYLAELQSIADDLSISRQVCWLGAVGNPLSILMHCDVGVLSSQSEGFSNALLEYAAAGIPSVATDVGGTREIVKDALTGFLVPPRSPELMADRICQLLQDDALRKTFGNRAAMRVRELFSEEGVLDQYSQLYMRVAGKNGAISDLYDATEPAEVARVAN